LLFVRYLSWRVFFISGGRGEGGLLRWPLRSTCFAGVPRILWRCGEALRVTGHMDNEADDGTNRLPIYNYYFKNSYIPLMLKQSITTSLTVEQ
jgi:hypothetical protein